jgi:hypothetical protein
MRNSATVLLILVIIWPKPQEIRDNEAHERVENFEACVMCGQKCDSYRKKSERWIV